MKTNELKSLVHELDTAELALAKYKAMLEEIKKNPSIIIDKIIKADRCNEDISTYCIYLPITLGDLRPIIEAKQNFLEEKIQGLRTLIENE